MHDPDSLLPILVVARAAYLKASGQPWDEIAAKLSRTVTEIEALPNHPEWDHLHKLAVRAVSREAETEARLELRRGLRSDDEDEVTAAADEAYRRQEQRHPRRSGRKAEKPADPTSDEQLVQSYLEFLNDMPAVEFLALEARRPLVRGIPPGPNVTAE